MTGTPSPAAITSESPLTDYAGLEIKGYQRESRGQTVLNAPSVFNYFSPFYRIPGAGAVAPEFQILNAASGLGRLQVAIFVPEEISAVELEVLIVLG